MNVFEQTKTSLLPKIQEQLNSNVPGATRHCQNTALLQDKLNKLLLG